MSTYVMSDIHGHKSEFDEMLDKIGFSSEDVLYILGDIIDKGPRSGEMLRWAVDDTPDNVHFLLGNHEDMAYCAMRHSMGVPHVSYKDLWFKNKGERTVKQLVETFGGDKDEARQWINDKMQPWIESLPLFEHLTVNGTDFMLVHGGFNPENFANAGGAWALGMFDCGRNYEFGARWETVAVGHGFGHQCAQDMLWARRDWHINEIEPPCIVVFGHSYIKESRVESYREYGFNVEGGAGKIAHIGGKRIDIDCGCAYADEYPDRAKAGCYNLACLRLDDMEEFYVPVLG